MNGSTPRRHAPSLSPFVMHAARALVRSCRTNNRITSLRTHRLPPASLPDLSRDRAEWARPPVQDPAERSQAEQYLRVFSLSTEYVSHCKVRQLRCSAARGAAVCEAIAQLSAPCDVRCTLWSGR